MFYRNKIHLLKIISLAVVAALCSQEVVWANPNSIASAVSVRSPKSFTPAEIIAEPSRITVPFKHAILKEVHAGTNGKLLIHIQDAHANASGQLSLARTLEFLMRRYGRHLVLVEGSSRDVTLDEVKKIADPRTWKVAARQFLEKGLIAGEEFLNLTTDLPVRLRGVEYQNLYDESLAAYARLVERRGAILLDLRKARLAVDSLKNKLYPRVLLEYEARLKAAGGAGGAGGSDGAGADMRVRLIELPKLFPQAGVSLAEYPQTEHLLLLQAKEKTLRFDAASRDQERLLAELTAKGLRGETEEYLKAVSAARTETASKAVLLNGLLRLAEANGVRPESYPDLGGYAAYLNEFFSLDMDRLFAELEVLEDEVYAGLLPKVKARKLRAVERFTGLLERAYRIQMSKRDFETLRLNEPDFDTKRWQAFVNGELVRLERFDDLVVYKPLLEDAAEHLKDFYRLVDKRDAAFLENTGRILQEEKTDTAYLVAGGYHTEHLKELMRQEGYSFVVLTPLVSQETNQSLYEKILLQPLAFKQKETRFAASRSALAQTATTLRAEGIANSAAAASRFISTPLVFGVSGARIAQIVDLQLAVSAARLAEEGPDRADVGGQQAADSVDPFLAAPSGSRTVYSRIRNGGKHIELDKALKDYGSAFRAWVTSRPSPLSETELMREWYRKYAEFFVPERPAMGAGSLKRGFAVLDRMFETGSLSAIRKALEGERRTFLSTHDFLVTLLQREEGKADDRFDPTASYFDGLVRALSRDLGYDRDPTNRLFFENASVPSEFHPAAKTKTEPPASAARLAERKRLLLLEDNADVVAGVRGAYPDYEVVSTADPAEAQRWMTEGLASGSGFDLVVSDLDLTNKLWKKIWHWDRIGDKWRPRMMAGYYFARWVESLRPAGFAGRTILYSTAFEKSGIDRWFSAAAGLRKKAEAHGVTVMSKSEVRSGAVVPAGDALDSAQRRADAALQDAERLRAPVRMRVIEKAEKIKFEHLSDKDALAVIGAFESAINSARATVSFFKPNFEDLRRGSSSGTAAVIPLSGPDAAVLRIHRLLAKPSDPAYGYSHYHIFEVERREQGRSVIGYGIERTHTQSVGRGSAPRGRNVAFDVLPPYRNSAVSKELYEYFLAAVHQIQKPDSKPDFFSVFAPTQIFTLTAGAPPEVMVNFYASQGILPPGREDLFADYLRQRAAGERPRLDADAVQTLRSQLLGSLRQAPYWVFPMSAPAPAAPPRPSAARLAEVEGPLGTKILVRANAAIPALETKINEQDLRFTLDEIVDLVGNIPGVSKIYVGRTTTGYGRDSLELTAADQANRDLLSLPLLKDRGKALLRHGFLSKKDVSLYLSGSEDEVRRAALEHEKAFYLRLFEILGRRGFESLEVDQVWADPTSNGPNGHKPAVPKPFSYDGRALYFREMGFDVRYRSDDRRDVPPRISRDLTAPAAARLAERRSAKEREKYELSRFIKGRVWKVSLDQIQHHAIGFGRILLIFGKSRAGSTLYGQIPGSKKKEVFREPDRYFYLIGPDDSGRPLTVKMIEKKSKLGRLLQTGRSSGLSGQHVLIAITPTSVEITNLNHPEKTVPVLVKRNAYAAEVKEKILTYRESVEMSEYQRISMRPKTTPFYNFIFRRTWNELVIIRQDLRSNQHRSFRITRGDFEKEKVLITEDGRVNVSSDAADAGLVIDWTGENIKFTNPDDQHDIVYHLLPAPTAVRKDESAARLADLRQTGPRAGNAQFEEYLVREKLESFDGLKGCFSPVIRQALLDDPALKPVFLRSMEGRTKPFVAFDGVLALGVDFDPSRFMVFSAGTPDQANRLALQGEKITVGVTDRNSSEIFGPIQTYGVANNRQVFMPLIDSAGIFDGFWIGIKGVGQMEDPEDHLYWYQPGIKMHGLLSLEEIAGVGRAGVQMITKENPDLFATPLGYSEIQELPRPGGGAFIRVGEIEEMYIRPVLGMTLFKGGVHRWNKITQIYRTDPDFSRLIRRTASSGGVGQSGAIRPDEWFKQSLIKMARQEAVKQNAGLAKLTVHEQDLVLATTHEADNEEFVSLDEYQTLVSQGKRLREHADVLKRTGIVMQGLLAKLSMIQNLDLYPQISSAEGLPKDITPMYSLLMPDKNDAVQAFFKSYFGSLDTVHLIKWRDEIYKADEPNLYSWVVNFMNILASADWVYGMPYDSTVDRIRAWASEELARRSDAADTGASEKLLTTMRVPKRVFSEGTPVAVPVQGGVVMMPARLAGRVEAMVAKTAATRGSVRPGVARTAEEFGADWARLVDGQSRIVAHYSTELSETLGEGKLMELSRSMVNGSDGKFEVQNFEGEPIVSSEDSGADIQNVFFVPANGLESGVIRIGRGFTVIAVAQPASGQAFNPILTHMLAVKMGLADPDSLRTDRGVMDFARSAVVQTAFGWDVADSREGRRAVGVMKSFSGKSLDRSLLVRFAIKRFLPLAEALREAEFAAAFIGTSA